MFLCILTLKCLMLLIIIILLRVFLDFKYHIISYMRLFKFMLFSIIFLSNLLIVIFHIIKVLKFLFFLFIFLYLAILFISAILIWGRRTDL